VLKDKLRNDYAHLRHKYLKRRDDWKRQLITIEERARTEKEGIVTELQRQIAFYKSQVDDMNERYKTQLDEFNLKLRTEIYSKQRDFESAVQGGKSYRQALIQAEGEIRKLQEQLKHTNLMLAKSDAEIERFRLLNEQMRQQMASQEVAARREVDEAVKKTKDIQKEKFKKRVEELEAAHKENCAVRLDELQRTMKELGRKDLKVAEERFKLHMKTTCIEIAEHEQIVRHIQAKQRESQKHYFDDVQAAKEAQINQVSHELQEIAEGERQRLLEVIQTLENQVEEVRHKSRLEIEESKRSFAEALDL